MGDIKLFRTAGERRMSLPFPQGLGARRILLDEELRGRVVSRPPERDRMRETDPYNIYRSPITSFPERTDPWF
jgi:hypothetical protein